eukprot:TRINITY_DN20079_c0_g1_i1.p1 TRINITY_DN20079_c0_g1~~TRINITY_DN20079_c0_g1_i1.p1  ORF type:complete len:807 (+),score=111.46 TRINITY_DN20079_c0_g1_i1:202-2421(+)
MLSTALSVIAMIFEVTFLLTNTNSKRRGSPPLRFFLLRLGTLSLVQMWSIVLHESMGPDSSPFEASDPRPAAHIRGGNSVQAMPLPARLPPAPPPLPPPAPQLPQVELPQAVSAPKLPRASLAVVGEGNFELDAKPEDLRWSPRTISVVLPCAEERDLAFKTVKSVFDTTPAEVLHEIVVVDDGSNPPLSETHLKPDVQEKYKVLIKRHENTVGLIGAKKTGGDAATGDIIVFFDCHVGPQDKWYEDFLNLIADNYRRMVIPQITALDIDTWKQIGAGGGMSKCYVTWDGDFKWGGTDDMYMGMLSGGLAGMSRPWWDESGGFDSKMLGWGGENIDQGVRMWVCGGEIVAAPNSQVAHMWRTGSPKTGARYRHVGDTILNRARAINAWFQEFSQKLDDYPVFHNRKKSGGPEWFGDMNTFDAVRKRLSGCRPFAWYLRRFKVVYEDAGLIPSEVFMIKEESSGLCLLFMGNAGTSGSGSEGVRLADCDPSNQRFFWHLGNRNRRTKKCCSGLRAWNTDQCLQGGQSGGRAVTGICELSGSHSGQAWSLNEDGLFSRGSTCLGPTDNPSKPGLKEALCVSFRSSGGARFSKMAAKEPIERELYLKAQRDHPEVFAKLNAELAAADADIGVPRACLTPGRHCFTLTWADGNRDRCLDSDGKLVRTKEDCALFLFEKDAFKLAESGSCLDTWSDMDPETWGFYDCHGGDNQKFRQAQGSDYCTLLKIDSQQCFEMRERQLSR